MRMKIMVVSGILAVGMGCSHKQSGLVTMPDGRIAMPDGTIFRVGGYACVAGPDEKCPDPSDYSALKSFQDKYKAPQAEQDAINGLWLRLQQSPPQGYRWDAQKLVYVKVPVAVTTPAPRK